MLLLKRSRKELSYYSSKLFCLPLFLVFLTIVIILSLVNIINVFGICTFWQKSAKHFFRIRFVQRPLVKPLYKHLITFGSKLNQNEHTLSFELVQWMSVRSVRWVILYKSKEKDLTAHNTNLLLQYHDQQCLDKCIIIPTFFVINRHGVVVLNHQSTSTV